MDLGWHGAVQQGGAMAERDCVVVVIAAKRRNARKLS
jgi:hypothetical protein